MPAFTHDLESTVLSAVEMLAFSCMVQAECYLHDQHVLAVMLSRVLKPLGPHGTDLLSRQASRMWRAER